MTIEFRAYRGEPDLLRLREFVMARYGRDDRWHVGDLVWRVFLISINHDPCENVRLFEREGEVVGFAVYDPRDTSLNWQLALSDSACEDAAFAWAKERYVRLGRSRGRLLSGALEADAYNRVLLERHGFRCAGSGLHMNVMDLSGWQASAPFMLEEPPRFVVRCVAGEEEHAARAQAHREVFHPSSVTDESYLRLMRMPGYERELDLVAVAPDGQIGAFCLVWEDRFNRVGEFEPVGTRPAYRRRGMARTVLLEGLRRLRERGCTAAVVWTHGDNDSAQALYESVGFRLLKRDDDYEYRDQ